MAGASVSLGSFVARELRAGWARASVLWVGLVVAAVGFSLLASESVSSAVTVQGTLSSNFQPAYDILVRPPGTRSALERKDRLVNDNFLSDLYGGISLAQWHKILHLSGVSVAAPIENVGYFLIGPVFDVNLASLIRPGRSQQLFRVVPSMVVHHGLASYPLPATYLYYSNNKWVEATGAGSPSLEVPGRSRPLAACPAFLHPVPGLGGSINPFDLKTEEYVTCTGPHQAVHGYRGRINPPGDYSIQELSVFPVLVSAIDPVQEAKLVDLPEAVVDGSYLREGEGISAPVPSAHGRQFHLQVRRLPLLVSSRTFVDEAFHVDIERLPTAGLPQHLASKHAGDYLDALSGPTVAAHTYPTRDLYNNVLAGLNKSSTGLGNYWTTGGVRFASVGHLRLEALPTTNPLSVWKSTSASSEDQVPYAPPGADGTQFRKLAAYDQSGTVLQGAEGPVYAAPEGVVQGTFDPAKLPGFAPLSKVPLTTFYPPTVTGATPRARALLGNRPLGPTTNLAGYLGQPPLALTTLKAASAFFDSSVWTGRHPRTKPIAAIEVRVSSLDGATRASIHRVERVATEIYRATHLQVDITAGSSPTPVDISLPAGRFGRPAIDVQQGWVKKGVATVVLDAADAKNTALFVLILVVAALFVANAVLAAVRQRRSEIATLVTLGWGRQHIFGAVLGEVAVVGLAAGLAGAGLAAAIIAAAGLHLGVPAVLGVIPAALVVALAAGVVPAWTASGLSPLEGLAPPVRAGAAGRRVRSVAHLAWVNLTRLPGRAVLGGFGLFVGVGALAFLLGVQSAFAGAVAGNVLGNHIDIEVRGADYVAVGLILVLAGGSVADVLIINLRERSGELAALRACGWTDTHLRRLVVTEGVILGAIGSLLGAGGGLGALSVLGAPIAEIVPGVAATLAAGIAVCAVALVPALAVLTRAMPATNLAAE